MRQPQGALVLHALPTPRLLLGAFVGCSSDGEEPDAFASGQEPPSMEVESPDVEQGLEIAEEAEPELGTITQAQELGTVCVPGSILGCSGNSVVQCNSTGTNTNLLPCAAGFSCNEGECIGTVCPANTVIGCSGPSLVVCK
ncbi:MAG TPA: hypothetical protein VNN80_17490 [Polyangiaceae bacterium]|nr:hypothetical protein [Polyangiaceae bacterium]